jgi:hypothetical protein
VRNIARDIWELIGRNYQGSGKVKHAQFQSLRRDFKVLCMKEDKFLMTSRFEYVVSSIEESNDVTTLSIDELQSSLLTK